MKELKPIRISINSEIDQGFKSCLDCIHANDSDEICVLRKCVHAIRYLYDCYEPKRKEGE